GAGADRRACGPGAALSLPHPPGDVNILFLRTEGCSPRSGSAGHTRHEWPAPLQLRGFYFAVIVAMIPVRMVQVAVHQKIHMVTMRNGRVSAAFAVYVLLLMTFAAV